MNIFLKELRAGFKSLLIWSGIIALLSIIGFAKFSVYANNPELLAILDNMPQALLQAYNLHSFNLTTPAGFYGVMFSYFALIIALAAALWGSDTISKEERDKTVEFSLTRPVSRNRVITAKLLAVMVQGWVLLAVTWGIVRFNVRNYHPGSDFYTFLNRSMLGLLLLQLIFLAIGLLLGCSMNRYKRAGTVASAVLLTTFFISTITGMHDKLAFLKYLTPFKYFDAGVLYHQKHYDGIFFLLTAIIVAVSLAAAYFNYNRRDLML